MDTSNINFEKLWNGQISEQPPTAELFYKINNFKKENRRRVVVSNLILICTSLFIIFVWYYYQPQLLTTKIGIVLTVFAMAIFVLSLNRSYKYFKEENITGTNQQYLEDLLALKVKQQFIQTTMLNLYFILLTVGIGLYTYEYVSQIARLWGVLIYGIIVSWALFNWFYIRPKQIKKQQAKLDLLISYVENLQV